MGRELEVWKYVSEKGIRWRRPTRTRSGGVYYDMGLSSLCRRSVLAASREAVVLEDDARDERRRGGEILFVILFVHGEKTCRRGRLIRVDACLGGEFCHRSRRLDQRVQVSDARADAFRSLGLVGRDDVRRLGFRLRLRG